MKTLLAILFALLALFLVGRGAYEAMTYATSVVPPGEYAGIIKLGVVCILCLMFGGLFLIAVLAATAVAARIGEVIGGRLDWQLQRLLNRYSPVRRVFVGMKFMDSRQDKSFIFTVTAIDKENDKATVVSDKLYWGAIEHSYSIRVLKLHLADGTVTRVK